MASIEKLIKKVPKNQSFSGNCGMFALALFELLKQGEIVLCINGNQEEDYTTDLDSLLYGEPDIWHVALMINNNIYDGSGRISLDDLYNFCQTEYGDSSPHITAWTLETPQDHAIMEKIIRWNTDWSLDKDYFKEKMGGLREDFQAPDITRIVNITKRPWTSNDVHYWTNPEDGAVNATIKFNGKKARLRAGIIILNNACDKILLAKETNNEFSLPGGGLEIDETPLEAGMREAQEEVHMDTKNLIDTGLDYCELHTDYVPWVKEHVADEKERWIHYYTCLIIGKYDGKFTGEVADIDEDPKVLSSSKWYKIDDVINDPSFKEQWKRAIDLYKMSPEAITEDLKDDAKKHFGTTNYWKTCFYINTDGTMLDGSGKRFGASGGRRVIDHRDIADIMPEGTEGNEAMYKYMAEGNIRFQPEARNFEIMKKPTYEQYEKLEQLITDFNDEVIIEIVNQYGDSIESFFCDYNEPAKQILAKVKRHFVNNESRLTEDTRNQLVAKSRTAGPYKDQSRGKNRFERKKYSKLANQVKSYNQIDMNKFFKQDLLEVTVPVTGETNSYDVVIKLDGVLDEIRRNIKANKNIFEYRTVLQALTKVFNTKNVYVKCQCDDFLYNFDHWSIVNKYGANDSAHDPGPGKGIANPHDDKGIGCKHILLALANAAWIMQVASVIHNYVTYAAEHMKKAFLMVIFPKLYDIPASAAEENGLVPEDTNLETDKNLIDTINQYAKNKGLFKKGENKNPAKGTGKISTDKIINQKPEKKEDEQEQVPAK